MLFGRFCLFRFDMAALHQCLLLPFVLRVECLGGSNPQKTLAESLISRVVQYLDTPDTSREPQP